MASTSVLLREDIEHLGARGDIVKVKAGYARNYLIPRRLAVKASDSNVKQIENERAALLKKAAAEKSTAEGQAEQLKKLTLKFERKVGEHGMLYGSVTSMDVAEALNAKGYEIDRRKIMMRDVIKEIGDFTVPVRLHKDVTVEVPVVVSAEGATEEVAGKAE